MKVPDIISNLLVSNSRILKEKFVQLIKDENTNYESERIKLKRSNLQFSCYTPQNVSEKEGGQLCFKLIDTMDKNVINNLIEMTLDETTELDFAEEAFKIKSIIYVFDESNIDTFTFVETLHKDLKKNYNQLFSKLKIPCVLCNLSNLLAIKSKVNGELSDDKVTAKTLEEFVADNKEITYTFYSSTANKIGSSNEQMNLVKNSFNKLISKVKFSYFQIDHENTIRPMTRSKTLSSLRGGRASSKIDGSISKLSNIENRTEAGKERGGTYIGEVKDNLRNGEILSYFF